MRAGRIEGAGIDLIVGHFFNYARPVRAFVELGEPREGREDRGCSDLIA